MWNNKFPAALDGPRITFYEPIEMDVPAAARPYTCYFSMVIFYKGQSLEEYGRHRSAWNLLGTRWTDLDLGWRSLAPFVLHEGKVYELQSGRVEWHNGRWHHVYCGRLVREDDLRLQSALKMMEV